MAQEKMQALMEGKQGPDIDEFFPRLADRIIALYASDVRYKTGGDNQGLSDVFILSKMFINSFVLGGLVKNDMQAPACIADVPFMNALVTRGGIVHRLDGFHSRDSTALELSVSGAIDRLKNNRDERVWSLLEDKTFLCTIMRQAYVGDDFSDFHDHCLELSARYKRTVKYLGDLKPCANVISVFMEVAIELPSQIMDITNFSKTCSISCLIARDQCLERAVRVHRFFLDSTIEESLSKYPCTEIKELSGVDNMEELKVLNMRIIDESLCDTVSLVSHATSVLKKFTSCSGTIMCFIRGGERDRDSSRGFAWSRA